MAFVNERISDEDIKKYNLIDVWNRYKLDQNIKVLNSDKPYSFAIDREKNQWLIYLAMVKDESWEPKRQSYTEENIFLFYCDETMYEVRLINDRHEIKEINGIDRYEITWSLKSIVPEPKDINTFKQLLKQALTVYGEDGLFSQDKEHLIECNF